MKRGNVKIKLYLPPPEKHRLSAMPSIRFVPHSNLLKNNFAKLISQPYNFYLYTA